MSNDQDGFRRALVEISEGHDKWIETVSNRAFEYGVLAIKNLLLVSGGALIGIPAIAGLSEAFNPQLAARAGLAFGLSVALSVACIYIIHINWLSNFHVALWERQKAVKHAWEGYLPKIPWTGESEEDLERRIKRDTKIIWWTFILPHLVGIASFISFVFGAVRLYESVGL